MVELRSCAGSTLKFTFLLAVLIMLLFLVCYNSKPYDYSRIWTQNSASLYFRLEQFTNGRKKNVSESVKNLFFLKTYKTGSSTLQNILYRQAVNQSMRILLPKKGHVFSSTVPFSANQAVEKASQINMILNHMRFNFTAVNEYLPKSRTLYISILRDVASAFESRVAYFDVAKHLQLDLTGYTPEASAFEVLKAENSGKIRTRPSASHASLSLTNWYYFQINPSTNARDAKRPTDAQIDELIRQTESYFDFILITELFDESLVVLHTITKWPLKRFVYFVFNEQSRDSNRRLIGLAQNDSEQYESQIRRYLHADDRIYKHFRHKLELKLEELGSKYISRKVRKLRRLIKQEKDNCQVARKRQRESMHPKVLIHPTVANGSKVDESCELFTRGDVEWCHKIRKGFINNLQNRL